MTIQGIEVGQCEACKGIWLDRGQIYHFAKQTKPLYRELKRASAEARPGQLRSPRTGQPMDQLVLFGAIKIDQYPVHGGV
jgi:Zn-finger nucleic acid-binding protein